MLFAVHCNETCVYAQPIITTHNDATISSFHIAHGSRPKFILKIDGRRWLRRVTTGWAG